MLSCIYTNLIVSEDSYLCVYFLSLSPDISFSILMLQQSFLFELCSVRKETKLRGLKYSNMNHPLIS